MAVEIVEGVHGGVLYYHYDVPGDVLYLRLAARRDDEVYGEEDEQGFHVLRSLVDDKVVGLTVIGFWREFGQGQPLAQADWQQTMEARVADLGERLPSAA